MYIPLNELPAPVNAELSRLVVLTPTETSVPIPAVYPLNLPPTTPTVAA